MDVGLPEIRAYASTREVRKFPQGPFLGVRLERQERYDILWFVWERDGLVPKQIIPQDWEPVMLFYKNRDLVQVTTRPHFEWHEYYSDGIDVPNFTRPLSVIFAGSHHAPLVRNNQDNTFDDILPLYAPLDTRTEIITDAPKFAQTSIFKRRGLYVQLGQNIHERAREALIELDKGR